MLSIWCVYTKLQDASGRGPLGSFRYKKLMSVLYMCESF